MKDRLLLLDLDGVVVLEVGPPVQVGLELLALHDAITDLVSSLESPIFVLTHRSRAEAKRILRAAAVPIDMLGGVMAAEDIALSALRYGQLHTMLKGGLRKSLIIPRLEHQLGIKRDKMALIDDRIDNVEDMADAGLGLVLHAPSDIGIDGRSIVTFDLAVAIQSFREWAGGAPSPKIVNIPEIIRSLDECRRTGHNTTSDARHAFNAARRIAGLSRRWISRRS